MNNLLNHQINTSILNQSLHQAALEYPASSTSLFSELQPITNLTEHSACLYRTEISATADLRNPSTTSGEIHLSGVQSSTALTQGHLEKSKAQQKLVPVSPEYRLEHEDEHTRIRRKVLLKRMRNRKLVPVPSEYRLDHEDEHTRIRLSVLSKRKLNRKSVPVPPEYRLDHEDENTLISRGVLENRKRQKKCVQVPPEHRLYDEDEHTLISSNALNKRKNKKLKSTEFSSEKSHAPHQAGETGAANTLTDSNSARQNSPILTCSPSGSNASSVPLALRCGNEDDNTRIMSSKLLKRKYGMKLVPVPLEYRFSNEDEHTQISYNALALRKYKRGLVPVPAEYRLSNEDEHTLINYVALKKRKNQRKLVPVPAEYRLSNEDEHTLISCVVLEKRKSQSKLVPVPLEHRSYDEDEHTLISLNALYKRKHRKLKSAAFSGEKPHTPDQAGETSVANTLADNNSARQNSPILTRSPSGSNAAPLHETTELDTELDTALDTMLGAMETDQALPPFESETAFSHWLDDLNVQQSAIEYIQNCHW